MKYRDEYRKRAGARSSVKRRRHRPSRRAGAARGRARLGDPAPPRRRDRPAARRFPHSRLGRLRPAAHALARLRRRSGRHARRQAPDARPPPSCSARAWRGAWRALLRLLGGRRRRRPSWPTRALRSSRPTGEGGKVLPIGLPEWVASTIMPVALGLMAVRFAWQASSRWRGRALAPAGRRRPPSRSACCPPEHGSLRLAAGAGHPRRARCSARPVFVAMGGIALVLFFRDGTPVAAVSAEVYRLIASPTLPAIPLLTACGYVLAESDAATRLVRFFRALFGWMPGGIAVMVAAVCALFTTFTGGSGVTIIALGGLVYPILRKDGYSEGFSLGLVTASGSLGLLFPPEPPGHPLQRRRQRRRHQRSGRRALPRGPRAGPAPGRARRPSTASTSGRHVAAERQPFSWREARRRDLGRPSGSWRCRSSSIGLFASGLASMVETAAAALRLRRRSSSASSRATSSSSGRCPASCCGRRR